MIDPEQVRVEAEIACTLGRAFEDVGRPEDALEYYERGAQLFREAGALDGEALAFAKMAEMYWEMGRTDLMAGYAKLALSRLRKVHHREAEAALLVLLGCAFRLRFSGSEAGDTTPGGVERSDEDRDD